VPRSSFRVLENVERGTWNPEPGTLNLGALPYHACQRPALAPAQRPRLDDRHGVADARLVFLVVHHELRRAPLGLAVQAVAHVPLHGDHDALLHLVADDDADFFTFLRHSLPTFFNSRGARPHALPSLT